MTARMENVRRAMGPFATRDDRAAALAEVEEWEAARDHTWTWHYWRDRAEDEKARAEAAEARADALAEVEEWETRLAHEHRERIRAEEAARVATALMEGAQDACGDLRSRAEAAEAEADRLKAALEAERKGWAEDDPNEGIASPYPEGL